MERTCFGGFSPQSEQLTSESVALRPKSRVWGFRDVEGLGLTGFIGVWGSGVLGLGVRLAIESSKLQTPTKNLIEICMDVCVS